MLVVAAVAATTIAEACRQSREFERVGVSGILAILEAYFPLSEDGVIAYFTAVADAVDPPLVVCTNLNVQRADLTLTAIDRLADIPNIRYIKDASTDTGRLLSIINLVGDRLRVFAASSRIPVAVMMIGGVGWMAGPAAAALWPLNELFARCALAACVKGRLKMMGYPVGTPLPPQALLSEPGRAEMHLVLTSVGAL